MRAKVNHSKVFFKIYPLSISADLTAAESHKTDINRLFFLKIYKPEQNRFNHINR
ncbi:MAG: hypothetical protein HC817_15245 [Saprospiraceae bacterium]|nr:hypothetical protein [Saprospiraceae bacterium]